VSVEACHGHQEKRRRKVQKKGGELEHNPRERNSFVVAPTPLQRRDSYRGKEKTRRP